MLVISKDFIIIQTLQNITLTKGSIISNYYWYLDIDREHYYFSTKDYYSSKPLEINTQFNTTLYVPVNHIIVVDNSDLEILYGE